MQHTYSVHAVYMQCKCSVQCTPYMRCIRVVYEVYMQCTMYTVHTVYKDVEMGVEMDVEMGVEMDVCN